MLHDGVDAYGLGAADGFRDAARHAGIDMAGFEAWERTPPTTRDSVTAALLRLHVSGGIIGHFSFDENGDVDPLLVTVYRVTGGWQELFDVIGNPPICRAFTAADGRRLPVRRSVPAMRTTPHTITHTIATALAVGAAMAPSAAAQQDLRLPDRRDPVVRPPAPKQDLRMPDRREPLVPKQDLRMPDTQDAAAGRRAPVLEFVRVGEPNAFDVTDAVVGAAGGIGLLLIGGGAMTAVRLRRRTVQPTPAGKA